MANKRTLTVDEATSGSRVDQALAQLSGDQSRSAIARLIEQGHVQINGSVIAKPSVRVAEGDSIEIEIPSPETGSLAPQDLPITIVYQDADIAIIDKAAGVVVHPGAGNADSTLVNALLHHLKDLSGVGGVLRPGIVHRLDKDTTGLLVVAKSDTAHNQLASRWNSRDVRKEYLALVYGSPKLPAGIVDAPLGRDPRDRKRMAVVASGRTAITRYEVVETLRYASLLRCVLETGRTHQIRVHLKSLGHPIIGDASYSGPQWRGIPDKKLQKAIAAFPRQALHAARLSFPHPRTGEAVSFDSPLPADFAELLSALR